MKNKKINPNTKCNCGHAKLDHDGDVCWAADDNTESGFCDCKFFVGPKLANELPECTEYKIPDWM